MIKTMTSYDEIKFILSNLRDEDKAELQAQYGFDWYNKTITNLNDVQVLVMYGNNKNKEIIPIAIGGFYEISKDDKQLVCVWLLTSKFIKYNKLQFIKDLKKQILQASSKYKIMYNFIYHKNFGAKKWLKKLGFKFDNPKPYNLKIDEGFEFFYRIS